VMRFSHTGPTLPISPTLPLKAAVSLLAVVAISTVVATTANASADDHGPAACTHHDVIPATIGSGQTPGQYASSGDFSPEYGAANAFDGDPATLWLSPRWEDPAWISVDLPEGAGPVTAYQIRFTNGPSLTTRAPQDWRFQGSNDGQEWSTLSRESQQVDWNGSEARGFIVDEPGAFDQYRLEVLADNDERSAIVVVSVSDIALFANCTLDPGRSAAWIAQERYVGFTG